MSDNPSVAERQERFRQVGRQAFIEEEMTRLGFWPPNDAEKEKRENALAELKVKYSELAQLRGELGHIEKEIQEATNVEALIKAIRKKRIEQVRSRRAERKEERARQQKARLEADQKRRREKPPFLGQGVSAGLRYEGGNPNRVTALGLPTLETARDIALAIGIEAPGLAWLTYHRGAATVDHYYRFTIPKRSGGLRVISSPKKKLRIAQSWILEAILSRLPIHEAAMAFREGRSILDNAARHASQAVVIRMDLKDFFPSIGFRRVKGLFESFGYNEGVASILALLTTEAPTVEASLDGEKRFVTVGARQLPQGACTSPALTNVLCRKLDARLSGLARSFGFTYTRYADDCIFSHPDKNVSLGAFLKVVHHIFQEEGFVVNEEKTRIMRQQHRQAVTGLVVNEAPHLSRRDLRRFRAFLHHCETEGIKAVSERLNKNALTYAQGYLAFIQMVSPEKAAQIRVAHSWLTLPVKATG